MSRIAYVNGRYLPLARRHGACRGPRLPVRRRRLRGLRGEGRAAGRRAPPYGAAAALARRTAHRRCRCRWRRSASCCARPCAATACATASSICRSPAAWRGATMPFRPPARAPSVVVTARSLDAAQQRAHRRRGHRGHHRAGQPLGAGRHQVGRRCCRTCWPSRRRASRAPRRPGSSTGTASSPKARPPMPGSSPRDGKVVTRPADHGILRGITRTVLLEVHQGAGA